MRLRRWLRWPVLRVAADVLLFRFRMRRRASSFTIREWNREASRVSAFSHVSREDAWLVWQRLARGSAEGTCVERALLARRLLARAGIGSELVIGWNAGGATGHAWTRAGNERWDTCDQAHEELVTLRDDD
jgi:hypothetical protein